MRIRFLVLLLLSELAFFGLKWHSPEGTQREMFRYAELCDSRFFIQRCIAEEEPYRPKTMWARDACYPALAYCLIRPMAKMSERERKSASGRHGDHTWGEICYVGTLAAVFVLGLWIFLGDGVTREDGLLACQAQYGPRLLMALALLLTPACLTALLRGNPSAWAAGLVFVFLAWHESSCAWRRVVAAMALGAAVALKLSPALFGCFYLVECLTRPRAWPWRDILLSAGTAVLLLIVPFFFFGGIGSLPDWFANALENSRHYVSHEPLWGFVHILNRLESVPDAWHVALAVAATRILAVMCIVLFFCTSSRYRRLFFVGAAMALMTHHDYGAAYMLPSFLIWAYEKKEELGTFGRVGHLLEGGAWFILLTPLQIPNLLGAGSLNGAFQNEAHLVLLMLATGSVLFPHRLQITKRQGTITQQRV